MNKKMKSFLGMMVFAFAMIPLLNVNALDVKDEAELRAALANGGEITLTEDIYLTSPLYVTKNTVIYGNDKMLTNNPSGFTNDGSNGSILAVMNEATAELNDLVISGANKYGVQAYEGGIVVFNGTKIVKSGFGAVLLNGGGAIVVDLILEGNTFGIEFGKGTGVTEDPALVMAGTITGTQTDLIVLASNDQLESITVGNLADSEMKFTAEGNKLVLKDKDNKVIATSNEAKQGVVVKEEEVEETPETTPTPTPTPDNTVTKNPETNDGIMSYIVIAILGLGTVAVSAKKLNKNIA